MDSSHRLLTSACIALAIIQGVPARAQNLIADPSFETGLVTSCLAGRIPDTWYQSLSSPDVYSFACTTLAGLSPITFDNFVSLPSAHDGLRFVAGAYVGITEAFGQTLAIPLVPGEGYELAGYFSSSDRLDGMDGYDIYLSPTTLSADGVLVGLIADGMPVGIWTPDTLLFSAPAGADTMPNLIMSARQAVGMFNYIATDSWSLTVSTPTAVVPTAADAVLLHPAHPNPFTASTSIRYNAPANGSRVDIRIFDVRGRLVRTLVSGVQEGSQSVRWDGRNRHGEEAPTGIYFVRLRARGAVLTRKIVLLD